MSAESPVNNTNRVGSPNSTAPSSPPSPPSSGGVELPFHNTNENAGQSPPPHSYRHSRAYRHFKNPPQPHMCIRVVTVSGEELFINVLSWTRIVMPQDPTDPIPLYGGMKVPPGSPRCPPLVYAVMANPEVLKYSGRHCKDPEERRAMIELMCDFVEAMNPDLRLTRNAVILKDRDISGELKDVWNAVQAQRDREREEQLPHQQQHQYQAPPPQQMFFPQCPQQQPQLQQQQLQLQQQPQQMHNDSVSQDNQLLYMEFGSEITPNCLDVRRQQLQGAGNLLEQKTTENQEPPAMVAQSAINNSGNFNFSSVNDNKQISSAAKSTDASSSNSDVTDSKTISNSESDLNFSTINANSDKSIQSNLDNNQVAPIVAVSKQVVTANTVPITTSTVVTSTNTTISAATTTPTTATTTANATITPPAPVLTTKKEKLGGFLPNGCHNIFPRFKNNKHKDKEKDKDKDKDKEKDISKSSSGKDKEKTLLNSFKRSSTAATNALNKVQQDDTKSQYEKNCINLEAEVEKLDLNKLDTPSNDVLIKLKVASSGAK